MRPLIATTTGLKIFITLFHLRHKGNNNMLKLIPIESIS